MNQENLHKKIESTLESIDNLQKAQMPTFFHTRLMARIENNAGEQQRSWMPIRRPALVIACLTVLLAANIFILMKPSEKRNAMTDNSAESSSLKGFASDYNLTVSEY